MNTDSPLPQPAGPADSKRRWVPRANRTVTTLLVARLESADGHDNLCRIRNLSEGGMQLETGRHLTLSPREPISVELRNAARLEGRVVWTAPGRAGVQFTSTVDVPRLLAPSGAAPAHSAQQPRAPRFPADCPVRVGDNGSWFPARLTNLSQSGARLVLDEEAPVEQTVSLSIPHLAMRRCSVRWRDDGGMGLSFFNLLTYAELSDWLARTDIRFGAAAG